MAEPLAVGDVTLAPGGGAALAAAWAAARDAPPRAPPPGVPPLRRRAPLYPDAPAFEQLVIEVLGRDIRSAHQRERGGAAADAGAASDANAAAAAAAPRRGRWRVVLDGVNVGYELDSAGNVCVTDAEVAKPDDSADDS